jgi:hypothetical protein
MPRASFKKADQGKGGSLYEGPIQIANARFGKTNYGGKMQGEAVALLFAAIHPDANDELTETEFILSVGKHWLPSQDGDMDSEDGPFLVSEKEDAVINEGSAFGLFSGSLEDARDGQSFDSADELNGLVVVVKREAKPIDGNKDRKVYMVVEVLDEAPWESKGGKASKPKFEKSGTVPSALAGKKAAKPEPEEEEEEDEDAVDKDTLLAVLEAIVSDKANRKGVKIKDLPKAVVAAISAWKDVKEKKQLMAQKAAIVDALDENFLTGKVAAKVISYEDDVINAA